MLVSYNWLKYYLDLPDSLTPEEVAHKLTMSTVEVEEVKKLGENLEGVVVGEILEIKKHPDADKLKVCIVSDGKEDFQVVCGGSNVYEGMLVAFGKLGAKVKWHGEGELVEITKAKIRGVESFGMICASDEIGLGAMFPPQDEKEILDLTDVIPAKAGISKKPGDSRFRGNDMVGKPLAEALGLNDTVFEIDNKSMTHRPDLWGHYGLAREVATLYGKKLKEYKTQEIKKSRNQEIKLEVKVEDTKLCPRYMAVAIDGIKIGPSPEWMQKLLLAVGLRSINNIVDITNFILYDLGQPMHAFDSSKFSVHGSELKIVIRKAKAGEKFVTLDEKEHELCSDDLLITDADKAVALAGVMGGLNSEIKENTTTIVFESANFEATTIRKTALRLGIRTDSSTRFEKSLDPNNAELALKRAVELTLEACPGAKIISNIADETNFKLNQGPIELSLNFLKMKMGIEVETKKIIKILESLGFSVKEKKDLLLVTIPTWRATKDISIAEDLVEEISRIYGYDNFITTLPLFPIIPPERNELRLLERKIKEIMSLRFGFLEVYNYSFLAPKVLEVFELSKENFIELDNPIAKDRPYLRHNLWPLLLENIEKNQREVDEIKIFEIGKVFHKDESGVRAEENSDELLPNQPSFLGLAYSGKGVEVPFYEVSTALVWTLEELGAKVELKRNSGYLSSFVHGGRQAQVWVNGLSVGAISEISPLYSQKFGLENRVALTEIDLEKLLSVLAKKNNYHKLSDYPEVIRDIAFIVDRNLEHKKIVESLKNVDSLISQVELFDVYEGNPSTPQKVAQGKKSLAYHLTYQSFDRTLTAEEVDKIQEKVIKTIEKEFSGQIR